MNDKTADDLAIAKHHIDRIFQRLQKHFPKSHPIMKRFDRLGPSFPGCAIDKLRTELDNAYHSVVSNAEADQHGHIYYNLEERFEKMGESR